jgi:hypothetical protein
MVGMQCNVELGNQLSICSGTKENLSQVGRSQDLPDTYWLLASSPCEILATCSSTYSPVSYLTGNTLRLHKVKLSP